MSEHQAVIRPTRPTPFTVFDVESGEILRFGTTQFQTLSSQATAPNEIVLEGEYQDNLYRFEITEAGPVAVALDDLQPQE